MGRFSSWAASTNTKKTTISLSYVSQVQNPGGAIRDLNAVSAWLTAGGPLLGVAPPGALPELPSATGRNSNSGAPVEGGSLMFHTNNQALNNAYGAFLQADYELNDQWKFTAGVRYSRDYLKGREYARVVNHYIIESLLEAGFSAGYTPLVGGNAALAQAITAWSGAHAARRYKYSRRAGPDNRVGGESLRPSRA